MNEICHPQCSVVVVTYNSTVGAADCLKAMFTAAAVPDVEWIVVDNSENHDEAAELERIFKSRARVVHTGCNLGFAGGVNRGVSEAHGDWILLLNPDVLISAQDVERVLISLRTVPEGVFSLAGCLKTGDRVFQGIDLRLGVWFEDRLATSHREMVGPSGGFGAFRRVEFLSLGGLDEGLFAWGEDVEFALRARSRGFVARPLDIVLPHLGGHSVIDGGIARKRAYSLAKNRFVVARKYYSPLKFGLLLLLWVAYFPGRFLQNRRRGTVRADIAGVLDGLFGRTLLGKRYLW